MEIERAQPGAAQSESAQVGAGRPVVLRPGEPYDPEAIDQGIVRSLANRRISQVRPDLPFLVGLVALVAAEAVIATAFL
jgi:hypothetical protein